MGVTGRSSFVVEELMALPPPARKFVVRALTRWCMCASEEEKQTVQSLLHHCDRDERRTACRLQMENGEVEALADRLRTVKPEILNDHPACFIHAIAMYLYENGELEAATELLRNAQFGHNKDFFVNFDLGNLTRESDPTDWNTAATYFAVAASIHATPGVFCRYGDVLRQLDRIHEAKDAYQRAIDLNPQYKPAQKSLGEITPQLNG